MSKRSIPTARRALTPGHIRFFRAAMDGVELRRAWAYIEGDAMVLDEAYTPALASTTVHWIRETLIAEALSAGRLELIGLFRRDPSLVKDKGKPSLEEFAARFEHADAFSESELMALYTEEHGTASKAEERKSRLQARLRLAFDLLEKSVRKQPRAKDPVDQWLAPHLAEHLRAAGLVTLGAVRTALDKRKTPRWEEVPGIGARWADRLVRWMDDQVIVVQSDLLPAAATNVSEFGIVFMDRLVHLALAGQESESDLLVSPSPFGLQSSFKNVWAPYPASNNRIGSNDDKESIELWIQAVAPENKNTQRAYRRIAERLLLWCRLERRTTFAEIKVEDCIHYRTWLTDMGRKTPEEWKLAGWKIPAEQWIGNRVAHRDTAEWRPFEGPLSKGSVGQDLQVLRSFFTYLDTGRVVDGNVWALMGKANFQKTFSGREEQFVGRSFTLAQWRYLIGDLKSGEDEFTSRILLILWLGFGCGLRSAEMLSLTFASIRTGDTWRLNVLGKGDKWRTVTCPLPARTALIGYMASIGISLEHLVQACSGLDAAMAAQPILRGQKGRRKEGRKAPSSALSYSQMFRVLKAYLESMAAALESTDPVSAAQLRKASGHWLRHSFATRALQNGVPINVVQKAMGHASVSTTGGYLTAESEHMDQELERFAAESC